MQLRSSPSFSRIYGDMMSLFHKATVEKSAGEDNYTTLTDMFKILDEHIVFLIDCFYNSKLDQRIALDIILICDSVYDAANRSTGMNDLRETKKVILSSRKKAVVHLKKIMKLKKTYLSSTTLEQIKSLKQIKSSGV
jgi:hypothetical protein